MMKAIQISPKVWWVGAIDWQLKEFHEIGRAHV